MSKKFSIEEAQKTLDKRNGNFILLNYNGMRNKANVICNNKYATITWGNQKILFGLKNFIISNNIKVMNRKWNKIKEMV